MNLTRSSPITFGKYKGLTGKEIAHRNPGYILWIEENVAWVEIDPDLRKLAVNIGIMESEDRARNYGTAGDFGFDEF